MFGHFGLPAPVSGRGPSYRAIGFYPAPLDWLKFKNPNAPALDWETGRKCAQAAWYAPRLLPPSTSTEKPSHKITARAWPSDAGALLLLGAARQAYELIGCNSHLG